MTVTEPSSEVAHLRAEIARLQVTLDHVQKVARGGTWAWEVPTGSVTYSPELVHMLGIDMPPELDPQMAMEIVHADDRERVLQTLNAGVLAGPDDFSYTCRALSRPDEKVMHTEVHVHRQADGRAILITGLVRDVTELQRSEQALAESEAMQGAVVEAALDCVVVIDSEGVLVEWNPAAERTFGWTREEAIGMQLADLIVPPPMREEHRRAVPHADKHTSDMIGQRMERTAVRRDGTELLVELAIAPVEGEKLLWAGYLRDITERTAAEVARNAAESRWRALVEQIPVVTYLARFDETCTVLYISPQSEAMLGYPPERWIDQPRFWVDHVHPADHDRVQAEATARFREKRGFTCEWRIRAADGEYVWIDEQSTILMGEDGEPAFLQGVMVDVTDRKRHEEELREAQRLESVGQLAGGVAHDFNNLLGIIQGYAELLEADVSETARADVREIRKAAGRAADLTRQLLLFSRGEPTEAQVVDVNDVVGEISNMLERTVGEHVSFETALCPLPCPVSIPAGQLEQILVNLTMNARDSMPGGGVLSVSTHRSDTRVTLAVTDTGTGMSEEVVTRAFNPFFSTKEKGRGTGLGLATVYGIAQGAHGHAAIDSLPGRGTTVTIELPLALREACQEDWPEASTMSGRGETVLVVEDEDAVRELTGRILSESGYEVMHAADGYRAQAICDEHDGAIHLLLSDLVMPGMSGREVAEALRAARPEIKVLYMSGHSGDVLTHDAAPGDQTPMIEKPFDRRGLLRSVRSALA